MQHPVGYTMNHSGQPELNNVGALFTNPTFLWGYVHVILASLVTGSLVMLAVSAWYLRKQREVGDLPQQRQDLGGGAAAGDRTADVRRQQARRDRDEVPADEDRRGGGAVVKLPAVLVLGVPDRGGKNDHTPSQIIEITSPAVDPGDGHLERPGRRG